MDVGMDAFEKIQYESFDIAAEIRLILTRYQNEIKERELRIAVDCGMCIQAFRPFRVMVGVILEEMLSNSIFYNKNGGTIRVFVGKEENSLVIEIEDTGIGIGSEDHENIFRPLFRTPEARECNPYGAGLGLHMVRNSVKRCGGDISVQSRRNHGSLFRAKLQYDERIV